MSSSRDTPSISLGRAWIALAACVILFGSGLRFVELENPVWWIDEAVHSVYAYGSDRVEVRGKVLGWDHRVVRPDEVLALQALDPSRGPAEVVSALYREEPQSPPVHYLMLHYWSRAFGDSIPTRRALSALQSLLVLVGLFWLCRELFRSTGPAWIATSLAAVSPVMMLFAREVRYYILWAGVVALLTAMLLWAARSERWGPWIAYGAGVAFGLWVLPLTGFICVAHGLWLVLHRPPWLDRALGRFIAVSAVAWLTYLPWLTAYGGEGYGFGGWRDTDQGGLIYKIVAWIHMATLTFVDGNGVPTWNRRWVPLVFLVMVGCLVVFLRRAPRRILLLALLLGLVLWLPFAARDLLLGGSWSHIARYHLPSHIALVLVATFAVARGLRAEAGRKSRVAALATWLFLLATGTASSLNFVHSETWWHRFQNRDTPELARLLDAAEQPLVVGELSRAGGWSVFGLAHEVDPDVRFLLTAHWNLVPEIPPDHDGEVFVFEPVDAVLERFAERGFEAEEVAEESDVYRLVPVGQAGGGEAGSESGPSEGGTASTALRFR